MKKILLHPDLKKIIIQEFKCSNQTVDMCLKYVFNSPQAIAIRNKAKELLLEESNKIEN